MIGSGGEVLVLDMGDQVRIADMARRLVATASRDIDIVYTGLRPGEKLSEDLLGRDEVDERPHHPLIRHVPVDPLPPGAVTCIDPASCPDELRSALAACSGGDWARVGLLRQPGPGSQAPAARPGGQAPAVRPRRSGPGGQAPAVRPRRSAQIQRRCHRRRLRPRSRPVTRRISRTTTAPMIEPMIPAG